MQQEMKSARGYDALRRARSDARLVGKRKKAKDAKAEKEE